VNFIDIDLLILIPMVVLLVALFFYLGWKVNSKLGKRSIVAGEERAKVIIADAQKEANNIKREKLLEVKDEWYKKKIEFDTEANQKRQKFQNQEKQLSGREDNIEKKLESAIKKEKENRSFEQSLFQQKKNIDIRTAELDRLEKEQNTKLEKISGLTAEEAKKLLLESMEQQAEVESNKIFKEKFEKAKLNAKQEAQKVVVLAIQRTAADHSVETTVSVVQIQNDELKGRIIGKEGRNIRSFEAATGVDVIVDDTLKQLFFRPSTNSEGKLPVSP